MRRQRCKLDWNLGGCDADLDHRLRDARRLYSRGDIDGGFGAVVRAALWPGLHPVRLRDRRRHARPRPDHPGIAPGERHRRQLDWLAGVYYFDEDLRAETSSFNSLAPGNPLDGFAFQSQDAKSWAVFASLDYAPNDDWSFKGGVRYTTDEKDFSAERPDPTFQTPTVAPITASTDADLVTWDLSATRR